MKKELGEEGLSVEVWTWLSPPVAASPRGKGGTRGGRGRPDSAPFEEATPLEDEGFKGEVRGVSAPSPSLSWLVQLLLLLVDAMPSSCWCI